MKFNSIKNEGSCPPPDESSSLLSTHLLLGHFTFPMAVLSHPSFLLPNCTNYGAPCYAVSSSFYHTYVHIIIDVIIFLGTVNSVYQNHCLS